MSKKILGLDLGTNSIGWALFEANEKKEPINLIDLGVRIFQRAVEDKTPTPKNQARRNARMARRIIQRRARRKQKMLNFLVNHHLLPEDLKTVTTPEVILNSLGNPYELRAKALDEQLAPFELGRVLLHLVQRRGFQSNRKTLLGDMIDDPDMMSIFSEDNISETAEDTAFKNDIAELREKIKQENCRTLGEYLNKLPLHQVKRNRAKDEGHLRTDRQMYKDEFWQIVDSQIQYHSVLEQIKEELFEIIFFQRPLKLKKDRVGKCSLEPKKSRAKKAWLAFQKYRYLQDINSIKVFESYSSQWNDLTQEDRQKLIELFEHDAKPTVSKIKKVLGFSRNHQLNFENALNKNFKGNTTAIDIRKALPSWDDFDLNTQIKLEQDLITFESKKALKERLLKHWKFDKETALKLCLVEFEPEYSDLSFKAINKLLPYLEQGMVYSDARVAAGYGYEQKTKIVLDKLPAPPEIPNPIVMKGLHELKRVVNAVIKEYGKPDIIRLEMARDLEMNTKRYKSFTSQQNKNTKLNTEAQNQFANIAKKNAHLGLSKYASHTDKLKYRLWQEQQNRCAYSNQQIALSQLFTSAVEIDHILPFSLTLDDSYMNKVVCLASENQFKGQRTPFEAFGAQEEKWNQIEHSIANWYGKGMAKKRDAFYKSCEDLDKDFITSQISDTRYISREALHYLGLLGADVNTVKGQVTSWLRHAWGMNRIIDEKNSEKDRTDHRHHAIDAAVIACVGRSFYNNLVQVAKDIEKTNSNLKMNDLYLDTFYPNYFTQVQARLNEIIIAHAPMKKITSALHEDTGIGYIEGLGTVYRKNLDERFTVKQIDSIIDKKVRQLVKCHFKKFGSQSKVAFSPENPVMHKDGKTPIKRVRVLQSATNLQSLETSKLGIKDKEGNTFKWMTLGNTHHVEIYQNKKTGKYQTKFVTALEAKQRVNQKLSPIRASMDESNYLFSLHSNDLVQLEGKGVYRVQYIDADGKRLMLREHKAAKIDNKLQEIRKSVVVLLKDFNLKLLNVNAIGKEIEA